MNNPFYISEVHEATTAALQALDVAWVPPSVELDAEAFTLFSEVPACRVNGKVPPPKVEVRVFDNESQQPEGLRNASDTKIRIYRAHGFVGGGPYNPRLAAEIFRSSCQYVKPTQKSEGASTRAERKDLQHKREITRALTELGRRARICEGAVVDGKYPRAKGLGKKALTLAVTASDFSAIKVEEYSGRFRSIETVCGTWMLSAPREGDKKFEELSVLTVAGAAGLLMAGLLRASRQVAWKEKASPALDRLSAAAADVGILLLQTRCWTDV